VEDHPSRHARDPCSVRLCIFCVQLNAHGSSYTHLTLCSSVCAVDIMFVFVMPEVLVILVVALIVLGPKRLPDVAKALGKGLAEFRKATAGLTEELRGAQGRIG